ncbi:hypothetical protein C1X05_02230 [Laceyella sacchari]|uniref:Uncharacterized protein n=1 Tax=Laceyella tengchongensis TaxID=574699 RepID=A0AA46AH52_9BACL|nr:hypothetical protein [Laceyella tengchongensis]AUS07753.1 hypothetical protein C1X05_02230 [Laceyella sacchari]SMP34443.1 hypothetical protein SAMN06265361_11136 [Laceyella tengchongensis]
MAGRLPQMNSVLAATSQNARRMWFAWVLRSSACLHGLAGLFMLFVLVHALRGDWLMRTQFVVQNEWLVTVSWSSMLLSSLGLVCSFGILTFALNKQFRFILHWAWLIQLIGSSALALHYVIQMVLYPALMKYFVHMPTSALLSHINKWDDLLSHLATVFAPSCLAIGGFIYTAAMFYTPGFSRWLSWWSLLVWSLLLAGSVVVHWSLSTFSVLLGLTLACYVPWLWKAAKELMLSCSR